MFYIKEIEQFVSKRCYSYLTSASNANYEVLKKAAMDIIHEETGLDLTTSPRPAELDKLRTPYAWIIEYLQAQTVDSMPESYLRLIESNYDKALDMLKAAKVAPSRAGKASALINIEGVYSANV